MLSALPPPLRPAPIKRLTARVPVGIPADKIVSFPSLGLTHVRSVSTSRTQAEKLKVYLRSNAAFCSKVVRTGFGNATHVYAFSGAALEILEASRAAGIYTVLEQPSAAHLIQERIMAEEFRRFPDWEEHETYEAESLAYAERERQEWNLADKIVVPSRFVSETLHQAGAPVERCVQVPYGVDGTFHAIPRARRNGPLRVLCVGGVRLQKGPQYILEAARLLGPQFDFRLVGWISISAAARRQFDHRFQWTGVVSRSEIMSHFQWADVFLLPSLCEGQALVLLEALASGLPIVATPNSGLPIHNEIDGFSVPIRDGAAIAERLDRLASDRELLFAMSKNARERAAEFTLNAYGNRLNAAIAEHVRPACIGDSIGAGSRE